MKKRKTHDDLKKAMLDAFAEVGSYQVRTASSNGLGFDEREWQRLWSEFRVAADTYADVCGAECLF